MRPGRHAIVAMAQHRIMMRPGRHAMVAVAQHRIMMKPGRHAIVAMAQHRIMMSPRTACYSGHGSAPHHDEPQDGMPARKLQQGGAAQATANRASQCCREPPAHIRRRPGRARRWWPASAWSRGSRPRLHACAPGRPARPARPAACTRTPHGATHSRAPAARSARVRRKQSMKRRASR